MSLKQDIEKKFGIPVKLRMGMPGAMDIYLDKEMIYSKGQTGRMPSTSEVMLAIERRNGG